MGTPNTTRPKRAGLSAITTLLAGLTFLLTAGAANATPAHNSSQITRSSGAAAASASATGVSAAAVAAVAQAALTGPAAGSWGGGRLDLFYRNSHDGRLTHQWYLPGSLATWTAAESLGGTLTSQPAVTSWAAGRYDVFARGTDNAVWHKWFSGGKWSAWQSLGGQITGEPAAASTGAGKLDLFVRGTNNALFTRYNIPAVGWSPFTSLGGTVTSSPSATMPAAGVMTAFVRGANGLYYYRQRSAAGMWSGWQAADAALAFRGLGAWADIYDYSALNPATAVADLKAHGVRTLYLGTARYDSATDILYPNDVAAWLAAAHTAGIRVVGWYVPVYSDLTRDVRRTLAIASYVSPAGQRFDAVGIDSEYPLTVPSPSAWNQAVATHLAQVRAGTVLPVVAIVLPPVLMQGWPDPSRWANFPWSAIGANANAVAPESYWTSYTPANRCAAGDPQYCAYQYTHDNVLLSGQYTGLAVHVIGGSGSAATVAQVADYVRAARETAAAGGSFYDYLTTNPGSWPYLEQLNP